jgi:transcriptional regulator with GAF, ATPase, and Fis domain
MDTEIQLNEHLVVLSASGEPRCAAVAPSRSTTIGSGAEADLRLQDCEVDTLHAEIERSPAGAILLRRGGPVWVNGRRVSAQPLQHGDLISLGRCALSFREGPPPGNGAPMARSSESHRAVEVLRRLYAISRRLYAGDPLDEVTQQIVSDIVELTNADKGMLLLFEGETGVRLAGSKIAKAGDFDPEEINLSQTAIAKIKEDPRPRIWTDIEADPDLAQAPSIHRAGVRSLMAAPVLVGEELIGVLYLCHAAGSGMFEQGQLDLLSVYAAQAALLMVSATLGRELSLEVEQIRRDLQTVREQQIWGSSAPMRQLLQRLDRVAPSSISVLVIGETGTGKELCARELHRCSDRSEGPFVPVNCGAIPGHLLESELFGHVKGAFTGATKDRMGKMRSATGGTLFLDEIGEMPIDQQAKLLRVLEDRQVTPVGGDKSYAADFRLVCATNQELEQRISEGQFRRDLFYRVAGFVLEVPSLREREDDAVELARLFLKRHAVLLERPEARLSAAAMTAIRSHRWEGNVRELQAAVQRALVVCEGDIIHPADLGLNEVEETTGWLPLARARDDFVKQYVKQAVSDFGGNRTAAARALKITPRTVFKYLEEV